MVSKRVGSTRLLGGVWAVCLIGAGCAERHEAVEPPAPESVEARPPSPLAGENLAGSNLGGANLGGSNLGGTNLGGANLGGNNLGGSNLGGSNLGGSNLGGTNLGGNNLGGSNLGGSNLGGVNLGGSNLGGSNLAGRNLGGSNLGGSNVAGINLGGNNLGGSNLGGSNLGGSNTGYNIHGVPSVNGMLYSGEDVWSTAPARCVVMGIGSTAFAKLLGQQSANATISVALGKLPWGFSATSGAAPSLRAWEALVWGDRTYCSFVLAAPTDTTWAGVAGFIKAVFRWQAPPTQTMNISGIEASARYDSTLSTAIASYTGMMNVASHWRQGLVSDRNLVAGEVAFVSATTNNQSVQVDFASWVMDSTGTGLILGDVQKVNPPTRAESVYYAVDDGDGTVSVRIAAAASGLTTVSDTFEALNAAWATYQDAPPAPKPVPRRCGGALYLNYYYGEPVPAGKCDDNLSWGNASSAADSRTWSTVLGTTAPMNQYMLLPLNAATPLKRGTTADDLKVVLSETYIHTWDAAHDPATGLTVVDDSAVGTGLNRFNYVGATDTTWRHSTLTAEAYGGTSTTEGRLDRYATFTFQGTMVQLYLVQDPDQGISAISIDNGPETLVDLYSKTRRGYRMLWAASGLSSWVNHTVKIRVTGTRNPKANDSNTSIDAAVVGTGACKAEPDGSFCTRLGKNCGRVSGLDNCGAARTVAACGSCTAPQTCGGAGEDNVCGSGETVDDSALGTSTNQFNYVGTGWQSCSRCGNGSLYNASKSESKATNDHVAFKFRGVKIRLYGTKGPAHGLGGVSVDGGAETSLDFYNATLIGDQLLWTSPTYAFGDHTLKLRVTGGKNSKASGYYIVPDRVTVTAGASCTPESDATFCARLGKNCGEVTDTDSCGLIRTVSSCGTCGSGKFCGEGVCQTGDGNLLTNPSFQSGTTGWLTTFIGVEGTLGTSSSSQDGDGRSAVVDLQTSSSSNNWDRVQVFQARTANGSPYTFSAWFQRTGWSSKTVTLYCREHGGDFAIWAKTACTNSSGWTRCSVTCDPAAGQQVRFGIGLGTDTGEARIDNFSLVQ